MFILAILLSLVVGVSLGLLGGGGSILTIPILRYVLGMEAHEAIALSLLVVGTTSLAAVIAHARRGRVRLRTGLVFGLAGMAGAYAAGRVAHFIPAIVLLVGFALMMLVTAFAMLRRRPPLPAGAGAGVSGRAELPVLRVLGQGAAVGAVAGLVGAGGGFVVVPALVLLGNLPMDAAVGTSLVVISMQSLAGFAGYLGRTPIDWQVAISITGAAMAGSFVGGALAARVHPAALREGFGWFVIAMAIFILGQELPPEFGAQPHPALAAAAALLGSGLSFAAKQLIANRRSPRGASAVQSPSAMHPPSQDGPSQVNSFANAAEGGK